MSTTTSTARKVQFSKSLVLSGIVGSLILGCSGSDTGSPPPGTGGDTSAGGNSSASGSTAMGGALNTGGSKAAGGSVSTGGTLGAGGSLMTGGTTASGGVNATGGTNSTGGAIATGGSNATGGTTSAGGTVATGGSKATGGTTSTAGTAATGGSKATGGIPGAGGAATGGNTATGGAAAAGGPNCSATMPTGGVTAAITTSANTSGQADGLDYGGWTNGSGGTVTYFTSAHAFGASWSTTSTSNDFLAHLGLDFRSPKVYTAYGTVVGQFVESKTGTAGGYSSIGMYGWTQSPCVEWYIVDDSFRTMPTQRSSVTAPIDGGTYYLISNQTTGTGGNACESGHTGPWTQLWSVRSAARQCATITVSDHFAAWTKQGWSLGNLISVYINVETGGGVGSIQFPVANVTTSSN